MTCNNAIMEWPLVVIDFEAGALSIESYPIEVGIAIMANATAEIEIWSTLIKPAPHWNMRAQWNPDAERIHGISLSSLSDGLPPRETMIELNRRIPPGATVWCDGGHYDVSWLRTLALGAETVPAFELGDLGEALRQHDALRACYLDHLGNLPPPHRAGPDAERICKALIAAMVI